MRRTHPPKASSAIRVAGIAVVAVLGIGAVVVLRAFGKGYSDIGYVVAMAVAVVVGVAIAAPHMFTGASEPDDYSEATDEMKAERESNPGEPKKWTTRAPVNAALGVTVEVSSDRCFRCGHARGEWTEKCSNCHTEFLCNWDPDWYQGRLTRISIGQDEAGRAFGNCAAFIATVLLLYGLVLQVFYAPTGSRDAMPLLALFMGGFATYEVWGYFNGRATCIDHMHHEPRPENTTLRTLGLVGDAFILCIALAMLYDVK